MFKCVSSVGMCATTAFFDPPSTRDCIHKTGEGHLGLALNYELEGPTF